MTGAREVYVVCGVGRDVTGLVSLVTSIISDTNGNIIDLQENVLHNLFSIVITVDLSGASIDGIQFISKMQAVAHQSGLQIIAEKHRIPPSPAPKRIMRLLLLGPDHPGIVSASTFVLANNGVNIERARMVSRGDLFAMELDCDWGASPRALAAIERSVGAEMKKIGIRSLFQSEDIYRKRPRLLVFLVTRNLLEEECRAGLLALAGDGASASSAALKGLPVDAVGRLTAGLRLNADGEELLRALKLMGFVTALAGGGYDLFLEPLRRQPCVDRISADALAVWDGRLTGETVRAAGEAGAKTAAAALAAEAGIPRDETLTIGDAPGADIRVPDHGLGLLLDPDAVRELLAAGVVSPSQIPAVLSAFGLLA